MIIRARTPPDKFRQITAEVSPESRHPLMIWEGTTQPSIRQLISVLLLLYLIFKKSHRQTIKRITHPPHYPI